MTQTEQMQETNHRVCDSESCKNAHFRLPTRVSLRRQDVGCNSVCFGWSVSVGLFIRYQQPSTSQPCQILSYGGGEKGKRDKSCSDLTKHLVGDGRVFVRSSTWRTGGANSFSGFSYFGWRFLGSCYPWVENHGLILTRHTGGVEWPAVVWAEQASDCRRRRRAWGGTKHGELIF